MSAAKYSSARVPLVEGTLQLLVEPGSPIVELRFGSAEGKVSQAASITPSNLVVLQDQISAALAFLADPVAG